MSSLLKQIGYVTAVICTYQIWSMLLSATLYTSAQNKCKEPCKLELMDHILILEQLIYMDGLVYIF